MYCHCYYYMSKHDEEHYKENDYDSKINPLAPDFLFFFNFGTPVYKMWITQEPKKVALWNKRHFEEKKTESVHHV